MKLSELDPVLKGSPVKGQLHFDCPHPGCHHRIVIQVSDQPYHEYPLNPEAVEPPPTIIKVWQASGEFPDSLTITPSIDIVEVNEKGEKIKTACWHGHIINGEIK